MDHKNCKAMLESLSDYVDGTLSEQLCAELDRHLAECEDCRIVVDTLRKTVYLYRATAPAPHLPDSVRQRLYKRLELDEYQPRGT